MQLNPIAEEMWILYILSGIDIGTATTLVGIILHYNLWPHAHMEHMEQIWPHANMEHIIYPGTGGAKERARTIQGDLIRTAHP